MNRMHTSNFLFSIKIILVCKLRLAPNQALHVTSIYGVFGSSLLIESTDSTIPLLLSLTIVVAPAKQFLVPTHHNIYVNFNRKISQPC